MDTQAQAQATRIFIKDAVKSSINESFYLISDDISVLINDNITKYSPHFYTLFSLIAVTTALNVIILILLSILFKKQFSKNTIQQIEL